MPTINPVYVIPDPSYGKKARDRFSLLCERVEGDSASCVINAHNGIAKLWSPEAHIYDIPAWDVDYRGEVKASIHGVEEIVDRIAKQLGKFKEALPVFGTEQDKARITNAEQYCKHAKQVIEGFRTLPFYEALFTEQTRF